MKLFLGKLMTVVLMFGSITAFTPEAKADITDSSLFEPVLLCAVGGGVGYAVAQSGQEIMTAAIACGGGALIGLLINSHYSSKYGKQYMGEIGELKSELKAVQLQQALRLAKGEDESIAVRVREVKPGEKRSDGSVSGPQVMERLVTPGELIHVGD